MAFNEKKMPGPALSSQGWAFWVCTIVWLKVAMLAEEGRIIIGQSIAEQLTVNGVSFAGPC
jgi:hypothetical protein